MVATEGEQALIAGQSDRWRGVIDGLVGLKGIKRIKIFFLGQLTRQQIRIQREAGRASIPLLASIVRHKTMLRDPVKCLGCSADGSRRQHVARQPDPCAHSEQRQGEQQHNQRWENRGTKKRQGTTNLVVHSDDDWTASAGRRKTRNDTTSTLRPHQPVMC